MVAYTEGSSKCTDEIATLKKELKKCHEKIEGLSTKLELYLSPFCDLKAFIRVYQTLKF